MTSLAEVRQRYEATPRPISDDLIGLARGDRGCLGDLLAGLGAAGTAIFGILAALGAGGWGYMAISAACLLIGFVASTVHQTRSSARRRHALSAGPLVLGHVLRAEKPLTEAGAGYVLTTVLFTTAADRRFDAAYLRQLAERLKQPADEGLRAALAASPRIRALPAAQLGAEGLYVTELVVDGARLSEGQAEAGEVTLVALPDLDFAEHI